jgi:TPR repeat protein
MKRLMTAAAFSALCLCCITPGIAGSNADDPAQATMDAARKGDALAQLKLGEMYDLGEGVTQDLKEAVKWYRLAAEQGNSRAQFSLAEMYKNGDGVQQDMQQALKWYRKAAGQGNSGAQLLLGVMYESGTGVRTNFAEAAKWYRLSANGGDSRAQLLLANLYNLGHGVARNPVVAYALYTVSAENEPRGNPSLGHRARLSQGMKAEDIGRAAKLAREMAKPGNLLKALDQHLKNPA